MSSPLKGKGCGTPSYFCASILTNEELIESLRHQALITDRLCEKKESKNRPGHPSPP